MDDKKKKIVALFILFSFIFSSLAFAIISSLTGGGNTGGGEEQLIYNQPLSAEQEQKIISSGKVIVKVYTATDCSDCGSAKSEALKLFSKLSQKIIVEDIDTNYFSDNTISKFPTIIILGAGSDKIESAPTSAELLQKVCMQFKEKPAGCA